MLNIIQQWIRSYIGINPKGVISYLRMRNSYLLAIIFSHGIIPCFAFCYTPQEGECLLCIDVWWKLHSFGSLSQADERPDEVWQPGPCMHAATFQEHPSCDILTVDMDSGWASAMVLNVFRCCSCISLLGTQVVTATVRGKDAKLRIFVHLSFNCRCFNPLGIFYTLLEWIFLTRFQLCILRWKASFLFQW